MKRPIKPKMDSIRKEALTAVTKLRWSLSRKTATAELVAIANSCATIMAIIKNDYQGELSSYYVQLAKWNRGWGPQPKRVVRRSKS